MLPPSPRRLVPALLVATLLGGVVALPCRADPAAAEADRVSVGDPAPEFALESARDGTVHRLSDLEGAHPTVLVFFRGTW